MDARILAQEAWKGALPVVLTMAASDVTTYKPPDARWVRLSAVAYGGGMLQYSPAWLARSWCHDNHICHCVWSKW